MLHLFPEAHQEKSTYSSSRTKSNNTYVVYESDTWLVLVLGSGPQFRKKISCVLIKGSHLK